MKEPDFRGCHLLLDEQHKQILASGDDVGAKDATLAEHARTTIKNPLRSIKTKA
jgi:DNA-binding ferritin-like protein